MNLVSQILAGVTGSAMVVIGLLEITRHGDRRLYPLFLIEPGNVPAVRMWAINRRLQHRIRRRNRRRFVDDQRCRRGGERLSHRALLLRKPVPSGHLVVGHRAAATAQRDRTGGYTRSCGVVLAYPALICGASATSSVATASASQALVCREAWRRFPTMIVPAEGWRIERRA